MRPHRVFIAMSLTVALRLGAQDAGVVLRPGDHIEVTVPTEATLSGTVAVDERGIATFPVLGARLVAGLRWAEVRDSVLAAFRRELKDSSITLVPLRRGMLNAPVESGDQLFVERRRWWDRNSAGVVGALISATAILLSVFAR